MKKRIFQNDAHVHKEHNPKYHSLAIGYNWGIYKGVFHEEVLYQLPQFVNNSHKNYYFTNYSTYIRSVSTKIYCLFNNLIKGGDFPDSEIATLSTRSALQNGLLNYELLIK